MVFLMNYLYQSLYIGTYCLDVFIEAEMVGEYIPTFVLVSSNLVYIVIFIIQC